jgi:hypothetical protein
MSEQAAASAPQPETKPEAVASAEPTAPVLGAELVEQAPSEPAPTGEKAAETAATSDPLDTVPEKPDYELKFSEGVDVDTGLLEAMQPVMHELGITRRQAQALAAAFEARVKASLDEQAKQHTQIIARWAEQARSDPEYSEGFEAAVTVANRALDKLGTPELHEVLKLTGLNNHPAVLKLFWRVGKMLREDGTPAAMSAPAPEPIERRLYGKTTPLTRV